MKTKIVRDSNIELLRLVCMFYILLHHFIVHGLKSAGYNSGEEINMYSIFFNSLFVIAVNCFILISGYFGINPSLKGFLRLFSMCVCYLLFFTIFSFIQANSFNTREFLHSFLPISHAPATYWFIKYYFYLYFSSFILNKVISNSTKKDFILILIILSAFTFYFGYLWGDAINGAAGYNLMNFIFLYFIGRYIALYTRRNTGRKQRIQYLTSYIANSLICVVIVYAIFHYTSLDNDFIRRWGFGYNSPFVIMSAISFFLLFRSFQLKSKVINWLAQSALAIYLIHENQAIRTHLYKYIGEIGESINQDWLLVLIFPALAILIMLICIFIDKIRILLVTPVENFLVGKIQQTSKYILSHLHNFMQKYKFLT